MKRALGILGAAALLPLVFLYFGILAVGELANKLLPRRAGQSRTEAEIIRQ